jgi:streptomycin 6-kinase
VVLKVGAVSQALSSEAQALRLYARANVKSVVRLLEQQSDGSALLLERITPGEPLSSLQSDKEATLIAAAVIRALWRPAPAQHGLRLLPDWCASLLNATPSSPLPWSLLERAQKVLYTLLNTAPAPVLLHGDLHHENILRSAGDQWRVIDPKGIVGDPSYEVATFLLNPSSLESRGDAEEILAERIELFATHLGLERWRVASWGFVQATLSLCWMSNESPAEWLGPLRLAEILARLHATY